MSAPLFISKVPAPSGKERFGKSPGLYCKYCGAGPGQQCKPPSRSCDIETAAEAEARVERQTKEGAKK